MTSPSIPQVLTDPRTGESYFWSLSEDCFVYASGWRVRRDGSRFWRPRTISTNPQSTGSRNLSTSQGLSATQVFQASGAPSSVASLTQQIANLNFSTADRTMDGNASSGYSHNIPSNEPEYQIQSSPMQFFTIGKVFTMQSDDLDGQASDVATQSTGSSSRTKKVILLVIEQYQDCCMTLRITTYQSRGVACPGVIKSDHAIIYTTLNPPDLRQDELPTRNESSMQPIAIRVNTDSPIYKLAPTARVNLRDEVRLSFNSKVKGFGNVTPRSLPDLFQQRKTVSQRRQSIQATRTPSSVSAASTIQPQPSQYPRRLEDLSARTGVISGQSRNITDPVLWKNGMYASQAVLANRDHYFPNFSIQANPSTFFSFGCVFVVLWDGSSSDTASASSISHLETSTTAGTLGNPVHCPSRRLVVVMAGTGACSALPILTYGGEGVGRAGVVKSDHGIIYTGDTAPRPMQAERADRGEPSMRHKELRVITNDPRDKLDPKSRIHYKNIITVHHRAKVKYFGYMDNSSRANLWIQFNNVWENEKAQASGAINP